MVWGLGSMVWGSRFRAEGFLLWMIDLELEILMITLKVNKCQDSDILASDDYLEGY